MTAAFDPSRRESHSPVDRFIGVFDRCLRAAAPATQRPGRPSPALDLPDVPLEPRQRRHSAGLMRVNHTGEVCAQALYLGQAFVAGDTDLKASLRQAAAEERDHLKWCAQRLVELDSRPSLLNPAWFIGSAAIAMAAAAISDSVSLGFVEETERQVCAHLDRHLEQLSPEDIRSRAILAVMRDDEARHAENARALGARKLSSPIRRIMKLQARVMTTLAYWI